MLGAPCQAGVFRGEEVVEECVVDRDRVLSVGEGGESRGLSLGNQVLGRPDVVRAGFRQEVRPISGLGSFDGLEVDKLGQSCRRVGVGGPEFFRSAGSICELLPEGSEEWGPPSIRLWGGA